MNHELFLQRYVSSFQIFVVQKVNLKNLVSRPSSGFTNFFRFIYCHDWKKRWFEPKWAFWSGFQSRNKQIDLKQAKRCESKGNKPKTTVHSLFQSVDLARNTPSQNKTIENQRLKTKRTIKSKQRFGEICRIVIRNKQKIANE